MWKRLTDQYTPQTWNQFVIKHGPASGRFLQSWEWGEFQKATGETVERYVFDESDVMGGVPRPRLRGVAQIMIKNVPAFGRYAYCPRGPIMIDELSLPELDSILFFRFDPPYPAKAGSGDPAYGKKTLPIQPAMTHITDVTMDEEPFFASLHQKTRYNIRLADRRGVHTRFDLRDLEEVWHLFESTSERGAFRLHEKFHYAQMLASLQTGACRAFLASAWFEDKPIAANIMIDFGEVRTYLHGASSYEHRSLMAPHLLHWKLMNDAREHGLTSYDWWGVSPENEPHHPWAGISRFKRSFPGTNISYAGTYDLIKRPVWYSVYRLARNIKRL